MISEGAWQDVTYINCDDYDGKNSPARNNFDFVKYISKVKWYMLIFSKIVFIYSSGID